MKHLFVEANLSGFGLHADDEEIVPVFSSGGQPNLAAHDHGRGPAAIRNRSFPLDIFRLTPMQRKANDVGITRGRGVSIAPRPAELGPLRPRGLTDQAEYYE